MPWPTTSRHERGYGTRWDKLRAHILRRDKYLCQNCLGNGSVTTASQVDHRKPKAKGGTDDPDNLWSLCRACHEAKTARDQGHRVKPRIALDGWPED